MIVKTRMSKWTEDLSSLSNILLYDHCCGESLAFPTAFPVKFPAYHQMGRVKRLWYLSPMRAVKVQVSLRIRAVSPEPLLLAHKSSESRGTFRQKARSLAPLNAWACTVKICHNRMLQDTNLLDGAQISQLICPVSPEPLMFAHMKCGSRRMVRPKTSSPTGWLRMLV